MDPLRQSLEVGIESADDNSFVIRCGLVQSNEVSPIHRDGDPTFGNSKRQNLCIKKSLPRFAAFRCRQHIVTKVAQGLNSREREVLVGVKAGHRSRRLVGADLFFDVVFMGTSVSPGIGKVLRTQRWVAAQKFRFAGAEAFGLN